MFEEHLTALRLLLARVGNEVDVLHTVFSPLSVVGQLCGAPDRLREFESSPSTLHAAIDAVTETLSGYARAAIDAGASGIFFAPLRWASHDSCDEQFYREYGRPNDLRVLGSVRDAQWNVLHVCGDQNMLELLLDYPVAAVNWADRGEGNPSLAEVKARASKAVMGGVDHTRLAEMSVQEVQEHVRDALSAGNDRLFITGSCSIPPATPAENRAVVAAEARRGVAD